MLARLFASTVRARGIMAVRSVARASAASMRDAARGARTMDGRRGRIATMRDGVSARRGWAAQAQFAGGRGSYTPAGPRSARAQSYGGEQSGRMTTSPPSVVTWTPELANSVTVIGNVGADPEIRHFPSGTCVANVRLAVSGGRKMEMTDGAVEEDKTNWFAVDIWGEEALRLAEHVTKGKTICVQGKLTTDMWTDKDTGAPRSRVKIVAKNFSFVQSSKAMNGGGGYGASSGYDAPAQHAAPQQQRQQAPAQQQRQQAPQQRQQPQAQQQGMPNGASPKEALWRSLAEEPDTWWDNRGRKSQPGSNPRMPDFKHKESGEALWIESRDTPAWVLETLGGAVVAATQASHQDDGAYRGASNPDAYEPDYSQPYGQQARAQYAGGYQPLDYAYEPVEQPFNRDDPPF